MAPLLEMTENKIRPYTAFLTKTELELLISKGYGYHVIDSYKSLKKIEDHAKYTKIVNEMILKGHDKTHAEKYGISKTTFTRREKILKRYRYLNHTTPNNDDIKSLRRDELSVFIAKQDPPESVVGRQKALVRAAINVRKMPNPTGMFWLDERIREVKKLKAPVIVKDDISDKMSAIGSNINVPFCYGVDNVF